MKKYDNLNVKIFNKKSIMKIIHKYNPISRNEIAKLTGLKQSSVTRLTKELIDEGYIYESGLLPSKSPGRKRISLSINKNYIKSMLVDMGVSETYVGIGYYNGQDEMLYSFLTPQTPKEFFAEIQKYYKKINENTDISMLVFSIPGIVDVNHNLLINVPNLGWHNIYINEFLNVDIPVLADNEANLSILAEKYHSKILKLFENIVFVIVREGIGTGLMLNGELYRGKYFSAGEFGHMTIDLNTKEMCHCGKTGCWEMLASIRFALKKFKGELKGDLIKQFKEMKELPEAKEVLIEMAHNLGKGLVNIVNSLNPEVIVLGGEIVDMPTFFYEEIIKIVRKESLKPASEKVIIVPSIFKKISSNILGTAIYSINYVIKNIK